MITGKYRGNYHVSLDYGRIYTLEINTSNNKIWISVSGLCVLGYESLEKCLDDWAIPAEAKVEKPKRYVNKGNRLSCN